MHGEAWSLPYGIYSVVPCEMPHVVSFPHVRGCILPIFRIEDLSGHHKKIPDTVVDKGFLCGIVVHIGYDPYVLADTNEWRREFDSRAVKKTLSIPSWLNSMAERAAINFSQTLQEALCQKLGVSL